ncbi:hypothetical protein QZH46_12300 [Pseudomonas corrugata]
MACLDRYSLPLSTTSDVAAEHYRSGVDLLLSLWPGAAETLEAAISVDPDFALAHAARARLHAVRAETREAKARIARAMELAQANGTERERSHVQVLRFAIDGQPTKALAGALQHADRWPLDTVILSLPLGAFGLFAFSGMADHDQARVELCERHARHFPENDWWFLTYRGWAHGENGEVALGRELTQRALELRRNNVNAVHAVAHVLHESGANDEAAGIIRDWLPGYDRSGILHGHIAWHGALVALERGDTETALGLYTEQVAPCVRRGTDQCGQRQRFVPVASAGLRTRGAGWPVGRGGPLCVQPLPAARLSLRRFPHGYSCGRHGRRACPRTACQRAE